METRKLKCDKCNANIAGKWWITWYDKDTKTTLSICRSCRDALNAPVKNCDCKDTHESVCYHGMKTNSKDS